VQNGISGALLTYGPDRTDEPELLKNRHGLLRSFVRLVNYGTASVGVQNIEITHILKHDTSLAVCLFPVVSGALFVQKWRMVWFRVGISCRSGVSAIRFKKVVDFLCYEYR